MQRQFARQDAALETSVSTSNKAAGGSNMDRQDDLGDLNVEGGEVTPGVAYGNTSESTFGSLAYAYDAKPGRIYEVTLSLASLMRIGAQEKDIGEKAEVGTLEGLGHDPDTDYIEVEGAEVIDKGATCFILRGGFNLGYDDEITLRVGNNGLLCLDRLARSANELGAGFGADDTSGYTLAPGKNLEVLCAMRMGNARRNNDARSDGFLAGVDPSDLRSRVQSVIYATLGASCADRVGVGRVTKPGIGIAPTAMWANRYRTFDPSGGTFSAQAAARLDGDINRLFRDRLGVPPETYITNAMDFSEEIADLLANNGTTTKMRMKAHMDFLLAVRDKLKDNLDLTFLDNTDDGFQERFRQHWMRNIDEVFARTQNWELMSDDERWIHSDHTYEARERPEQHVTAMVHDNSEGLQDGSAYFQMPDFSDWGMSEEKEEEGSEQVSETAQEEEQVDPAVVEAEQQARDVAVIIRELMAELHRIDNWNEGKAQGSYYHVKNTRQFYNEMPPAGRAVLDDLVDNGGSNVGEVGEILNMTAYKEVIDAWLALAIATQNGEDITALQDAFDAAVARFTGG